MHGFGMIVVMIIKVHTTKYCFGQIHVEKNYEPNDVMRVILKSKGEIIVERGGHV